MKRNMVGDAFKRMLTQMSKVQPVQMGTIDNIRNFLEQVSRDYALFRKTEADMILFGR